MFSGFSNWDAKHFLHISQHGYIYEQSVAFFPFYPITVRLFCELIVDKVFWTSGYFSYLLSGVLINFVFFNISSIYLFKLTLIIFKNNFQISFYSLIFYCINPASIFYSAVYSESLYSMLTFSGLYYLYSNEHLKSLILFILSCFTRSNGIVNYGFIAHWYLSAHFASIKTLNQSFNRLLNLIFSIGFKRNFMLLSKLMISFLLMNSAFFLYQYYVFAKFCKSELNQVDETATELVEFANKNGLKMFNAFPKSEWCNYKLPFSYTFVQSEYWKVGFLNYWRFKQIPNFLLASPILFLSIYSLSKFFNSIDSKFVYNLFGIIKSHRYKCSTNFEENTYLMPFACQLIFLLVSSVFFMHIQVTNKKFFFFFY